MGGRTEVAVSAVAATVASAIIPPLELLLIGALGGLCRALVHVAMVYFGPLPDAEAQTRALGWAGLTVAVGALAGWLFGEALAGALGHYVAGVETQSALVAVTAALGATVMDIFPPAMSALSARLKAWGGK
jgi:hypothetical protein